MNSESQSPGQAITDETRWPGQENEIKILFRFVILVMGNQDEKTKSPNTIWQKYSLLHCSYDSNEGNKDHKDGRSAEQF